MELTSGKADLTNALAAALDWHVVEGCAYALEESPVNNFALKPQAVPVAPLVTRAQGVLAQAVSAASRANSLAELHKAIMDFDGFDIKKMATQCVFAEGAVDADVMVIGEAPGADEDRVGKPFQGESGALLDKMLACIGLSRATNCYLTQVLPWRPPGNRSASDDEIALAQPFLERHIALKKPKVILVLGAVAAKAVLNADGAVSKKRGQMVQGVYAQYPQLWAELSPQAILAMPSFSLTHLWRTPLARRKAWQDLLALKQTCR